MLIISNQINCLILIIFKSNSVIRNGVLDETSEIDVGRIVY